MGPYKQVQSAKCKVKSDCVPSARSYDLKTFISIAKQCFKFAFSILNFKFLTVLVCTFFLTQTVLAEKPINEGEYFDPGEGVFSLSLEDVTQLALHNNFDIQLAQYDAQIAQTDEDEAKSIFDTVINAEVGYENNQRARSTTFTGGKSLQNTYKFGVSKKLPTGTTVSVDASNTRDWSNSVFATINPAHDAAVEVTLVQELGKNFFGLADRGDIKMTMIDIENTEYTSLKKIEENLAEVQKAYWDLVLAHGRVQSEKGMVEEAKKLFDLHQEKYKDGLVETAELLASEANYKKRINQLILVEDSLQTKENVLKLLLNIDNDEIHIDPTDDFDITMEHRELEMALKNAFNYRLDYKRASNELKSKDIELTVNKNNMWPEINLTASFERNGIGTHFSKALANVSDEDNPNWFTGVTFNYPLENRDAKSKLKRTELEKAKTILDLKYLERKISVGIIDQVRNANVLKEVAVNQGRVADLQSRKLAEEQKQFDHGRSDTDTIIRFQEDAIQAELAFLQAEFAHYSSLIDLKVKESTLLRMYWEEEK